MGPDGGGVATLRRRNASCMPVYQTARQNAAEGTRGTERVYRGRGKVGSEAAAEGAVPA